MSEMGSKKIYCLEIVRGKGGEQDTFLGSGRLSLKQHITILTEIFRTATIILELIIRKKKEISLERAKRHSPIWRHKADINEKSVNQEDLVMCNMQWKKSGYIKRYIISHMNKRAL
jgi:hypothetical protein